MRAKILMNLVSLLLVFHHLPNVQSDSLRCLRHNDALFAIYNLIVNRLVVRYYSRCSQDFRFVQDD